MLIMPDISMPLILIRLALKYDTIPIANIKKVSVITDRLRNRADLKHRVAPKPKKAPITIEIIPTTANCYVINHKVDGENSWPYRETIATYSVIATMSLKTPSPRIHEKSFG